MTEPRRPLPHPTSVPAPLDAENPPIPDFVAAQLGGDVPEPGQDEPLTVIEQGWLADTFLDRLELVHTMDVALRTAELSDDADPAGRHSGINVSNCPLCGEIRRRSWRMFDRLRLQTMRAFDTDRDTMVEIGGQTMTQAQFNAARYS